MLFNLQYQKQIKAYTINSVTYIIHLLLLAGEKIIFPLFYQIDTFSILQCNLVRQWAILQRP